MSQVNDLLEYSRLNHDTQERRKIQFSAPAESVAHEGSASENSVTTESAASVACVATESVFDLSMLTEDAVTVACLGFDQRSLQSQDLHGTEEDHSAIFILNIEEALSSDWKFFIAGGSWKRVCINLVANALKYTPAGYINVTLQKTLLKPKPGKQRAAIVELVVSTSIFPT